MKYPNNDLWSVREKRFLRDALEGYEGKKCKYFIDKRVQTVVEGVATYNYQGVIVFENQDRTILLEQGEHYGLKVNDVLKIFKEKDIKFEIVLDNFREM